MFIRKHLLCLLSILFFFQFVAFGQNTSLHQNLDKKNIAVSGYDVVEYFNHKPVKGNAAFVSYSDLVEKSTRILTTAN